MLAPQWSLINFPFFPLHPPKNWFWLSGVETPNGARSVYIFHTEGENYFSMSRCGVDVSDISCVVRVGPALEHVLQHGVVGRRQHPRSLQPLQAQQQRAKQNV